MKKYITTCCESYSGEIMIDEPIKVLRDDNEELVLELTDAEGGKRALHFNKIEYEDLLAFYATGKFSGRKYLERKYGKDV